MKYKTHKKMEILFLFSVAQLLPSHRAVILILVDLYSKHRTFLHLTPFILKPVPFLRFCIMLFTVSRELLGFMIVLKPDTCLISIKPLQ